MTTDRRAASRPRPPGEISMSRDLVLVKLDRANRALAEAKTIQQTKHVLDLAGAAEIYATRQQLGEAAIAYAHAIKIEALAKLGALLKETVKNVGTKGQLKGQFSGGSLLVPPEDPTPTLASLGLPGPAGRKLSMLAQRVA